MITESIPKFTAAAAKLWAAIPADTQKHLLSNVWCGKCRHEVIITNYSGTVKAGNLLLVGKCSECQGDVARVVELNGQGEVGHDLIVNKEKLERTQAIIESKQLSKEADSLVKSYVLLLKKKIAGTITKKEKAEYDRLEKQELPKMTEKLRVGVVNLEDAKKKSREQKVRST